MKVLVVCSENSGNIAPFVQEQADAVSKLGVQIDFFTIKGKGLKGYLQQLRPFRDRIAEFMPDIIHAHYGLCGLFANLQRKKPVVTTYHGSDINLKWIRRFSKFSIYLSRHNLFVSNAQATTANANKNFTVLPCGIDLKTFYPLDQYAARDAMGLSHKKKYILFSSSFSVEVKNVALARKTVDLLPDGTELIELSGFSRDEVNLLMNACDVALLTSKSEGSPQFIKEAMACNLSIVSVDVGDVKEVIEGTDGCFICDSDARDLAEKIKCCLDFGSRTKGRENILKFDNTNIALKLFDVYRTAKSE